MISSLRGTVLAVSPGAAIIEVAGVGYRVGVTPDHGRTLRQGSEALVHTVLVVREDELSLYGFASAEELEVFELLRSVSGVGPKSALGVLAAMTPPQVATAIEAEDDAAFRRVSGIGPKTAKLIVVSLAGKLPAFAIPGTAPSAAGAAAVQARLALEGLGFAERRVAEAVEEILAETPAAEVPAIVRLALARLGPAQRGDALLEGGVR